MKILYFDIAAIMIVSILLMSLYFRKMLNGRVNKILAWLLDRKCTVPCRKPGGLSWMR